MINSTTDYRFLLTLCVSGLIATPASAHRLAPPPVPPPEPQADEPAVLDFEEPQEAVATPPIEVSSAAVEEEAVAPESQATLANDTPADFDSDLSFEENDVEVTEEQLRLELEREKARDRKRLDARKARARRIPRMKGNGFVGGMAGLRAGVWVLTLSQVARSRKNCDSASMLLASNPVEETNPYDYREYDAIDLCDSQNDYGSLLTATFARPALNLVALGVSIPAAILRGRYDAVRDVTSDSPSKNTDALKPTGLVLAIGGGLGLVTAAVRGSFRAEECQTADLDEFAMTECSELARRRTSVGFAATTGLIVWGTGLYIYANSYQSHYEKRERVLRSSISRRDTESERRLRWTVSPSVSTKEAGLTFHGRF